MTVVPIVTIVNCAVSSVTSTGALEAGGPLDGNVTLTNSGSAAGSQDILWEFYVSTDGAIGGSDILIDSGTTTPIAAGATSPAIAFRGSWPVSTSAATYYLICRIDSVDMDDKFEYDTYKIVLGPSVTTLDLYAEWSSGFDDIDLAVWDETGAEGLSEDWAVDSEPGIQPVTFVGLTPGVTYYVAAKFMRIGGLGMPYSLVVFARP